MASFILTRDLQGEIAALRGRDMLAAAAALLLVETLQDDDELLEYLCVPANHFLSAPPFEVKKFGQAQRRGYNIFILKFLDEADSLPSYRIFIGFHAQRGIYYGLAITHRSESYDPGADAFRHLLDRYTQCDIPIYR